MKKTDSEKNICYRSEQEICSATESRYWQLEIVQGLHRGAIVEFIEESLIVVGSAHDCEIVLRDEGVAAHHFAIVVRHNTIALKALDGILNLNDSRLVNDQIDLLSTNTVRLENSDVEIKLRLLPGNDVDGFNSSQSQNEQSTNRVKDKSVIQLVWMMIPIIFLGLLISSGSFTVADKRQAVKAYADTDVLKKIITTLKLNQQLTVVDIEQGQLIKGVLSTQQRNNLEGRLNKLGGSFLINTVTPDQLLEQVGNVFRINGYTAKLQYQGGANVSVENLDGTLNEIQKIAAYIKQDVPSLVSLDFKKQAKPKPDVTPEYEIDPEKKMTTIIDGDIAYISTVDGARYFSGSVLPGGYTLKEITVSGVKVVRDNKEVWLKF